MTLSWHSLSHALEIFQETKMSDKDSMKLEVTGDALKVCSLDSPQIDYYYLYHRCTTEYDEQNT